MPEKIFFNRFKIGLVIFTKDEESTIGNILDESCLYMDKGDVFVVDGNSKDKTVSIIKEKGIPIFSDPEKGKGSAVQFAINNIDRDFLIFMDSDGSHKVTEIYSLLHPLLENETIDVVIGSRFKGGSEELYSSLFEIIRLAGNILGTFFINLFFRVNLTDVQNGFRAVRRKTMLDLALEEDTFAIEQEMVMKCLKNKKKIIEVPSWELKRKYNKSHIVPFKMLPRYIYSFIKNVF